MKLVDQKGDLYKALSEELAAKAGKKDALVAEIKAEAAEHGETVNGETLLYGVRKEIGFLEVPPSPVFDPALAQKYVPPALLRKCFVQLLSEELLLKLVQKGKLSQKLFAKCYVQKGEPIRRIIVRDRKH